MSLKIITEQSKDIILEENEKSLYVTGVFSIYDTPNKNGRTYKREVLEAQVKSFVENQVNNKAAWGYLGHPTSPLGDLKESCLLVEALEVADDGKIYGRAKVLDTPVGKTAAVLLREGALSISSRGLGEIDKSGMVKDYTLLGYDLVQDGSIDSFVNAVYESKEYIIRDGKIFEATETQDIATNPAPSATPEDDFLKLIELIKSKLTDEEFQTVKIALASREITYERKMSMVDDIIEHLSIANEIEEKCSQWREFFAGNIGSAVHSEKLRSKLLTGQPKLATEANEAHKQYVCHSCGEKMLSKNGKKPNSCSQCGSTDLKEMKMTGENVEQPSLFNQMIALWQREYRRKYL